MIIAESFISAYDESTHVTIVTSFALSHLMLIQVYSLNKLHAVDARDQEIRTYCLMHLDVFPTALRLAFAYMLRMSLLHTYTKYHVSIRPHTIGPCRTPYQRYCKQTSNS